MPGPGRGPLLRARHISITEESLCPHDGRCAVRAGPSAPSAWQVPILYAVVRNGESWQNNCEFHLFKITGKLLRKTCSPEMRSHPERDELVDTRAVRAPRGCDALPLASPRTWCSTATEPAALQSSVQSQAVQGLTTARKGVGEGTSHPKDRLRAALLERLPCQPPSGQQPSVSLHVNCVTWLIFPPS